MNSYSIDTSHISKLQIRQHKNAKKQAITQQWLLLYAVANVSFEEDLYMLIIFNKSANNVIISTYALSCYYQDI